jgi:hypothetical protein
MARPTGITQKELTGYAKAMQAAGVPVWAVDVEKPDGTRIRIAAGTPQSPARGSNIDKMLGITNG